MRLSSSPAAVTDATLLRVIGSGADALELALDAGQLRRLVDYLRLVEQWNVTYNLTAIRDVLEMATLHVLDSLAIVPLLAASIPPNARVLDVGSGAGLPGVVLAIARPTWRITCVDSVGKKASFVTQAAVRLALTNLTSIHARIESLPSAPTFDAVISRAYAALPDFVRSTQRLRAHDGRWFAMKGKLPDSEIADAAAAGVRFDLHRLVVPGLDAERCLLIGRPLADGAADSTSSLP